MSSRYPSSPRRPSDLSILSSILLFSPALWLTKRSYPSAGSRYPFNCLALKDRFSDTVIDVADVSLKIPSVFSSTSGFGIIADFIVSPARIWMSNTISIIRIIRLLFIVYFYSNELIVKNIQLSNRCCLNYQPNALSGNRIDLFAANRSIYVPLVYCLP